MTKVYCFDLLENKVDIDQFLSCLPSSFKNRVEKYTYIEDKKRSVIAYYLLYKYLISDFNYNPLNMHIEENEYQKPYLDGIYFNISHSHNYVCVVISDEECGIDIELLDTSKDYSKIARKVLKNEEYGEFLITNNIENVIRKWVLMEAYYKYLGTGIIYSNLCPNIDDKYLEKEIIDLNKKKYFLTIISKSDDIDILKVVV